MKASFFSTILFLAMCFTLSAQTLTCYNRELVDKRASCTSCANDDELFTGIVVTKSGVQTKLYAPIKVKIYSDRYFKLIDAYGNGHTIDTSLVTTYNTKAKLLAFLEGCQLDNFSDDNYYFENIVTTGDSVVATIPVINGRRYTINYTGTAKSDTTSSGFKVYAITASSATGTLKGLAFGQENPAATTLAHRVIKSIGTSPDGDSGLYTAAVSAANSEMGLHFTATFECTHSGTIKIKVGPEVGGRTATFVQGTVTLLSN